MNTINIVFPHLDLRSIRIRILFPAEPDPWKKCRILIPDKHVRSPVEKASEKKFLSLSDSIKYTFQNSIITS